MRRKWYLTLTLADGLWRLFNGKLPYSDLFYEIRTKNDLKTLDKTGVDAGRKKKQIFIFGIFSLE